MTGKYNEIMSRLEMSDEVKARILNHVTERMSEKPASRGKVIPFSGIRRYAALAACLAVVLLAVFALPKLQQGSDNPPEVAAPGGVTEYATAEELSAAMGFPVEGLAELPFTLKSISYFDFFGDLAQVTYSSEDADVIFRKARGSEDISGDNNEYSDVHGRQVGRITVTLKGNDGSCSLAFWQQNGFFYALSFVPAVSEQEAMVLVNGVINK